MTNSSDRLDRVEAILEELARSHQLSNERLTRTEAIVAETSEGLRQTRQIADSNARAVQAWESRIAEAEAASTAMVADTNRDLREAIADTVAMIADLAEQQGETDQRFEVFLQDARADRQRADERKAELDQRFEVFLQDARADRQRMEQIQAENAREHQEWGQRFDAQLAAMREDREANATEHRVFSETIRVLLAEIARIWQRLAG